MALVLDNSLVAKATITPLSGTIGAEVSGIDLGGDLTVELIETIHALVAEHAVVAFRDQPFGFGRHGELTERLGGHGDTPFLESVDGHPGLVKVVKEADEPSEFNFGGHWHSDWSFQERPPAYTLLHGHDIPANGGDTLWSNQYLAYETLSDGLKGTGVK